MLFMCKWLHVEDRIKFKILTLTWKSLHQQTPGNISELINVYSPQRALRSKDSPNYAFPKPEQDTEIEAFKKLHLNLGILC